MTSSVGQAIRATMAELALLPERWRSGVAYNPLSARTAQDPYRVYAALRSRDPVHRSRLMNAWLFTRHADADTILRDHRSFGSDPRRGTLSPRQRAMLPSPEEFAILLLDSAETTRGCARSSTRRSQTTWSGPWRSACAPFWAPCWTTSTIRALST